MLAETKILSERTEGVVEHDNRFDQMMNILVELMNEYQMDPKAISQLAARRIYEKFPKPPWVNDADAHTLQGSGEKESKAKPESKSGKAEKGSEREVEESSTFWENIVREVEAVYDEDLPGDKDPADVNEIAPARRFAWSMKKGA